MRGVAALLSLLRSQWLPVAELQRLQNQKLARLVHHAYTKVPYYRKLFDSVGLRPDAVRSVEDLRRLPVSTRKDLQQQRPEDLTAAGARLDRCTRSRTSGATGVPLQILGNAADNAFCNPSYLRVYWAWGFRPWHRLVQFQTREERLSTPRSWYELLGLYRRRVLYSLADPEASLGALKEWRPQLLHGYSLTLKLLADAARRSGVEDLRIPLTASTSGVLDEYGRGLIASAFDTRVVDLYAAEEAGSVIAWECPECPGYHINVETVVVEFLKGERAGEPGCAAAEPGEEADVVITNLTARTMPFIRYAIGDTARLSDRQPVCGRGLPLMDSICGRSGDYIVLASGRRLVPHPFFLILDETAGVGEWQVVQEDLGHINVLVTMVEAADEARSFTSIADGVKQLVGNDVEIKVIRVEKLRRSPFEKLRSVVSHVR